ncbi:MAG: ferritin-like domain-containing protein [Actinobacteria bacterium]|nr:ferritin-like domain-containing protein [Actinomycetota bacterium]
MEDLSKVYQAIDTQHADKPASTRRQFVKTTGAMLGGLGLLTLPGVTGVAQAADPQKILNIAATAEVLATIVNTVGYRRKLGVDKITQRNVKAAAREELIHYKVLRSFGGAPLAKKIWVPDAVFKNRENFLNALQVGDQIFINAYLIATKTFGDAGNGELSAVAAEFMGAEAVHRALARQSLGLLGNDRVFMRFDQKERADGAPNKGQRGFNHINGAVRQLQQAGFGFGERGKGPGEFFYFDRVRKHTPGAPGVNTRTPDADDERG